MLLTQFYRRMRKARHLVIWCLLFALPVYGFSSTIVQFLGANHTHRQVASLADPMAGWVDSRRGSHSAKTTVSSAHSHSLFQRHHHDAGDQTVLALDAAVTDSAASDAASSPAASAALVLALASELRIDPAVSAALEWVIAPPDPVRTRHGERLERPPSVL